MRRPTSFHLFLGAALLVVGLAGCGARSVWGDPTGECGNGVLEAGEECDGVVADTTCLDLGFVGGTLQCGASCAYNTSSCIANPGTCGNGLLDWGEECDGVQLGGQSCQSLMGQPGTLACGVSCSYDTSGCGSTGCSPNAIGGDAHDYLVSEMEVPMTSSQVDSMGLDLDGDGEVDNKLGMVCSLLSGFFSGEGPTEQLNQAVWAGELVTGLRLYTDSLDTDAMVLLQSTEAELLSVPPHFDGSDGLVGGYPPDSAVCGALQGGLVDVSGGRLWVPVPTCLRSTLSIFVLLENAAASGFVDGGGIYQLILGGGLTADAVNNELLPAMVSSFNQMVADEPHSADVATLADMFDGNCVGGSEGCWDVVPGQGECAVSEPPVFTVTELRCNAILRSALAPDLDSDGDGEDDLLSVGWRVSGAPAYLVAP